MKAKDTKKILFPCELAMALGLVFIAVSVCFFIKSGYGVTVITSVPLTLYHMYPSIDFGIWNIVFNLIVMGLVAILMRTLKFSYIISLLLAASYGLIIDILEPLVSTFPDSTILSVLYFVISMIVMSFGIAIYLRSRLPMFPGDVLMRDIVLKYRIRYRKIKTIFDMACLAISVALCFAFLGGLVDIGIGTIISAFTVGTCVSFMFTLIDKVAYFEPVIPALKRRMDKDVPENGTVQ